MKTHILKTWPKYFQSIWLGLKQFEVRKNDRSYSVGDFLVLAEWEPSDETYTGRVIIAKVTFVLDGGQFGVEQGFVVMSLLVENMLEEMWQLDVAILSLKS